MENSGLENEIHKQKIVPGNVNLVVPKRYFAVPEEPLEMGLCGGPVLNKDGECVGILEGVVNPPSPQQDEQARSFSTQYQGCALFVPISEALTLINSIDSSS